MVTSAENDSSRWQHRSVRKALHRTFSAAEIHSTVEQATELLGLEQFPSEHSKGRFLVTNFALICRFCSKEFQSAAPQILALAALASAGCMQTKTYIALGPKPVGSSSHLQTLFLKNLSETLSAHLLCLFPSGLFLVTHQPKLRMHSPLLYMLP